MTGNKTLSFLSYGTASDAMLAALESLAANRGRPKDAWVIQAFYETKYAYIHAAGEAWCAANPGKFSSFEESPWMEFTRLALHAGCWPLGTIMDEGPCFSFSDDRVGRSAVSDG